MNRLISFIEMLQEVSSCRNLRPEQIFFSPRHPYDLCQKKISLLSNLSLIIHTDILILEDLATNTFVYKFCLTDLNLAICLDYDRDKNGNIKSNHFIVRSLRVEDSFDKAEKAFEVQFIFSKANSEEKYTSITYEDKRYTVAELPHDVQEKLSSEILTSSRNSA